MATQGSPGKTRMAKNTMLMAPSSMGTATRRRRSTYWTMAQLILSSDPSVEDLQHLWIVVAVVQRELSVIGIERGAHPLGVARPLARDVGDGQAHQVPLDALLGLGVDRGPLLDVPLQASLREQIVDRPVVGEVG